MPQHLADSELKEALAQPGCPLCRLAREAVGRFLAHLLYENVNDPGVRSELTLARGFCNLHAWQLEEEGDALGTAILYRNILGALVELLERCLQRSKRLRQSRRVGALRTILQPQRPCPACRARENAEAVYIHALVSQLDDPEVRDGFLRAGGLCLPHLQRTLEVARPEQAGELLALQREAWTQLLEQLGEFIRKQDYRFREEGLGAEGDSWIRALAQVSGQPGVW
jgi:hypothetical protein